MKVQTFIAIGGPLDKLTVTEQYAGPDYIRFNSSVGKIFAMVVKLSKDGQRHFNTYDKTKIIVPRCVLIHKSCFVSN